MFNLFRRKKKEEYPPLDSYAAFGADIHSHLIPGIDDGVKTMDESLEMIRAFSALGFKKLITTPHMIADAYQNSAEKIRAGIADVQKAVLDAGIPVSVDAAAEYYMDEQFSELIEKKDLLTIGQKFVLFEVSFVNSPENIYQVSFDLQVRGYYPLLAHPERYAFWHMKFDEYKRLKESGVYFQMNINSISGYYGSQVKKIAERLIDENMIDFIGSDLHGRRHLDGLHRTIKEPYLHKLAAIGVRNCSLLS